MHAARPVVVAVVGLLARLLVCKLERAIKLESIIERAPIAIALFLFIGKWLSPIISLSQHIAV